MGVELEDAEVGKGRKDGLDHGHGRGVIAAEHEWEQARPPPGGDVGPGRVELLSRRRAVR